MSLFWRRKKPSPPRSAEPATTQAPAGDAADTAAPQSASEAVDAPKASPNAANGGASPADSRAAQGASDAKAQVDPPHQPKAPTVPTRPTTLAAMTERLLAQASAASPPTDALNSKIVQAVQLSNAENVGYAPSQIAIGPDMMISQASGLVAQSAAAYFDGVSKLALASQSVLLKKMTEELVAGNLEKAAEDALGALATDVMMAAAAAVAAAAGAIEAESASFAIDKIDQSIAKYSSALASHKSAS